jgi:hypothetical protein
MASDPGEWYAERRELEDRLDFAVRHLQAYLRRLDELHDNRRITAWEHESMRNPLSAYLGRLVRELEAARDVGD